MREIVINKCYGGFGLSHEAVMLYAKLKGFELYPFVEDRKSKKYIPYVATIPRKDYLFVSYSKQPLKKDGSYEEDSYFYEGDIDRDDPALVETVRQLGEKANGECAKLKIVEIPEDIKWTISDYDGIETIEEEHKSWG